MPYSDPEAQRTYWRVYRRGKYKRVKTRKPTGISPKDLTGKRFGRLVVQWPSGIGGCALCWLCLCDCGNLRVARGVNLRAGHTKSCGCWNRENIDITNRRLGKAVHHKTGTPEFCLWIAAKTRAKKHHLPFDISIEDVVIPEHCPLLGIKLEKSKTGRLQYASPSIDKIKPELGYVKGNVWVISWRANTLKSDASLEELKMIVRNWEGSWPTN